MRARQKAVAETGDIFAGLFLGVGGAIVGVVGALVILVVGPGPNSALAAIAGGVIGLVAGPIASLLTTFWALGVAARSRWLRARLEKFWVVYEVAVAMGVAATLTTFIAGL